VCGSSSSKSRLPVTGDPKFLIHNYGHGGAGITLSFGCASVVADHIRTLLRDVGQRRRVSVAVIGSGVIGLTVASELRRRWPSLRITVYAKELDVRRTTSFKAAGQFEPSGIYEEYETDEGRNILADYLRRSRNRIIESGTVALAALRNCVPAQLYARSSDSCIRYPYAR
jgi:glycine/D-amino acid oxidase-like deaminating enzyme